MVKKTRGQRKSKNKKNIFVKVKLSFNFSTMIFKLNEYSKKTYKKILFNTNLRDITVIATYLLGRFFLRKIYLMSNKY